MNWAAAFVGSFAFFAAIVTAVVTSVVASVARIESTGKFGAPILACHHGTGSTGGRESMRN